MKLPFPLVCFLLFAVAQFNHQPAHAADPLPSSAAAKRDLNWPQFRGPDGQGHSNATGLPTTWSETENVRWKTPIHGRGWSSTVIWGDQIWLTTATPDGKELFAVCVDLATGKITHNQKLFDVEKPQEAHTFNSYASPTPVIEQDRVYITFGSPGTACLDTRSGAVLWQRRDLPCNHFRGAGSSPILFENLLIMHFDGFDYQYVVALDKLTGKTVWKKDRDADYGSGDGDLKKAFSTPLVITASGRQQLISPFSKWTLSYDPRTGDELWRVHYNSFSSTARPLFAPDILGGLLYLNTGFGKADLLAVRPDGSGDITSSHIAWKATKSIGSKPSAILLDGLIYAVHDSGTMICLDATTGKEIWTHRLKGEYSASPISADGHLYLCNESGQTTILQPGRTYQELTTNTLDDGIMASPAAVGHTLILRTKSALYRIELNGGLPDKRPESAPLN